MDSFLHRLRGTLLLKALLAITVVAAGDFFLFQRELLPAGLGALGLALAGALAIGQPAVLRDRRAFFALASAAVYAFAMIYDASLLAVALFFVAVGMALLLPASTAFDDGWRWFQRLAMHGIFSLFGPLADGLAIARVRGRRPVRSGGLRGFLSAIAIPLAGSLVFLWLFAIANPVIDRWIASLAIPEPDETLILRIILWLALGWLAWAVLRPRFKRAPFGTFDGSGDASIPGLGPRAVLLSLLAFNAVFLLQNAMDAAWLWGIVPLPQGITLAQYAHQGAYPLVVTALLTALFVLVALRPGSATAARPLIRRMVVLWIGQNLFLLFNAAVRTIDYIETYSLTVLRISALLWMALVSLGLALVLWRMLADKSSAWLINTNLAATGILLSAVCFVDLGAVAARWNLHHAREVDGDGARLDLCYLYFQGNSALLPLVELEQGKIGGEFGRRVNNVRRELHYALIDEIAGGGWQILNARRLERATELLGGDIGPRPQGRGYSCDGSELPPEEAYGSDGYDKAGPARSPDERQELASPTAPPKPPKPVPTLTESREL